MTKRSNFWKCIMGVVVIALLLVGTWAATSARLASALSPPAGDSITAVFELDDNIFEDVAPGDDWVTVNCTNTDNADVKTGVLFDGLGPTVFTTGGSKDDLDITS